MRGHPLNLVDQKYGMLTVVSRHHLDTRYVWVCRCDCGGTKLATTKNLRSGDTRSCGCIGRGNSHKLSHSKRHERHKDTPPPQLPLPCYTCSRWKPMADSELGGYCEGGVFLRAKPHLGSCSYKA